MPQAGRLNIKRCVFSRYLTEYLRIIGNRCAILENAIKVSRLIAQTNVFFARLKKLLITYHLNPFISNINYIRFSFLFIDF